MVPYELGRHPSRVLFHYILPTQRKQLTIMLEAPVQRARMTAREAARTNGTFRCVTVVVSFPTTVHEWQGQSAADPMIVASYRTGNKEALVPECVARRSGSRENLSAITIVKDLHGNARWRGGTVY